MKELASRQVHLDFHTSEFLPDIGKAFDKKQFQKAIKLGKLNSITVFAECHHGWSYYPTKYGKMHPNLDFDLMGEMIEAAHEIGVRIPIYITVGWSANDAKTRPEWLQKDKDGKKMITVGDINASPDDKRPLGSWIYLCPNESYAQHIYNQTREVCENYPVDGVFYDICYYRDCYCDLCLEQMEKRGYDREKPEDVRAYGTVKWQEFCAGCVSVIKEVQPEATVFFNGGANIYDKEWHEYQTHFEIEDLPTFWGGYDKMPLRAKYHAKSGKYYLGMTGKFHTQWGEFGGFKPPEALTYEIAYMMAYGARCSVGDQLHPNARMDEETYRIIGEAYGYAEKIEDYCFDGRETSNLGILLSGDHKSDEGLASILLENQYDFDVLADFSEIDKYDMLILPDKVFLTEEEAGLLDSYLASGKRLMCTHMSGMDKEAGGFLLKQDLRLVEKAEFENDYIRFSDLVSDNMVTSPLLCYQPALKVETGSKNLTGTIIDPYFNRTYARYSSHINTPYNLDSEKYPAGFYEGNFVYLAHPVCSMYKEYGTQYHKDYFMKALKLVYKNPRLEIDMPSGGRVSLMDQAEKSRLVLHALYAQPIERGVVSVIEDMPTLHNIKTKVRADRQIKRVYMPLTGVDLDFAQEDGRVSFEIPELTMHAVVVLDY